jgi:hypothetical protein
MNRRLLFSLARILLVITASVLSSKVFAHPHGAMQCGLSVHFQDGRPHTVAGRLLMDQTHSSQALEVMRDPATGQLDAGRQQRFLFVLKLQMARINWLFSAAAEGQALNLMESSEPTLFFAIDGRLGVNVNLQVDHQGVTGPDVVWKFSCQDPSWYWVSEFIEPESPVTVTGCAHPTLAPAVKVATGPLAGSVHVDVQCAS